jgi:2,3-bisphosphoglycerate-dependent phosphoglycerate mutase
MLMVPASPRRNYALTTVITLLCGLISAVSLHAAANTLYLVRHAEKQPTGADPSLTACGQARADALAASLAGIKLAAIYATPFQRTQQTALAVAQSQQLKVELYDPRQPDILAQQLRQHQQPVLIVGHSNTIPPLVTQLSGIAMAALTEQDYDMLYQVREEGNISVTLSRQAFRCDTAVTQ